MSHILSLVGIHFVQFRKHKGTSRYVREEEHGKKCSLAHLCVHAKKFAWLLIPTDFGGEINEKDNINSVTDD